MLISTTLVATFTWSNDIIDRIDISFDLLKCRKGGTASVSTVCQTCTVKSFNHALSDWPSKVAHSPYGAHTHIFSVCHITLWRVLLCSFLSLNCAHRPLMICAGATTSNVGHRSRPHKLGSVCHATCWQIRPNFVRACDGYRLCVQQTVFINSLVMIYQEDAVK